MKPRPPRPTKRLIPLLALAGLLAAALPGRAAAGPGKIRWEPYSAETFHGQTLEGELGRLTLPQNRSRPDGGTVTLAFVRLASRAERPGAPIVYLAGGPGGSGIGSARIPGYFETFQALREVADVILLDQRGTGTSEPRPFCRPSGPPPSRPFADRAEVLRHTLEAARACKEELTERGIDLAGFNTVESADDLENLRRALGAPKLSLLGFSYGTHLALAAVRRHGEQLERVALVGTEGPNHTRKLPSSLDTQVRKLSLLAAAEPAVHQQVPDLYALLQRLLARLEQEPMMVPVPGRDGEITQVPVGKVGLQYILMRDLGDGNDFPLFPALLHTIDQGDPSLLAWFVAKRMREVGGGFFALYFAVDGASGASPERWDRIRREAPEAILGDVADFFFPAVPDALGIPDLGSEYRSPIVTGVPTLFVSGTLDSNAPPYQAEELRWGFTRAHHLIVDHAGHEDMLGSREVGEVLLDFFRGRDVRDRRVALPLPRFLTVEEAKAQRLGGR